MKKIAVIGAGTMGNGIAHVFASKGYEVTINDLYQDFLDRAVTTIGKNLDRQVNKERITEEDKHQTLANITTTTDLSDAVRDADLVIEAATENEKLKLEIFRKLNEHVNRDTILATNTSSISITKIAAVTDRPEMVVGMHFMNPVPVMKLVEVIKGYSTSDEIGEKVMELARDLDKVPVEVNDYPGFVANRILMPMINEAIYTLFQGVAGVKEIDTVMKLGMAHPMGPLQLADFIGLDVCLSILNVLQSEFGNQKFAPCPLLIKMVTAGHHGVKTGAGFYDYTHGGKELIIAKQFRKQVLFPTGV